MIEVLLYCVSALALLATAQVVNDIKSGNLCEETPEPTTFGKCMAWTDLVVRQIPVLGTVVYRSLTGIIYSLCLSVMASSVGIVYNIEMLTPSALPENQRFSPNVISPSRLDDVWKRQCRWIVRAHSSVPERAWVFTPSNDYVIRYQVYNSFLRTHFIAFYPAGKLAIFPPEPLHTYWKSPTMSKIKTVTWSIKGSLSPASDVLVECVKACAGPRQAFPPLPIPKHSLDKYSLDKHNPDKSMLYSDEKHDSGSKHESSMEAHELHEAHDWTWTRWKTFFPAIFAVPSAPVSVIFDETNLSPVERRKLARLRAAALSAMPTTTSGGEIDDKLLVTRADQSFETIPIS
jgi:hypothetical protein